MEVPDPCPRVTRSRGTPIKTDFKRRNDAMVQPAENTLNPQPIVRSAACALRARLPGALGSRTLAIKVNGWD